jgi:hypothetical protein
MSKVIVYKQDGSLVVGTPTPDALSKKSIHDIAKKCVPAGTPYKIMDQSDLPADRTFRDAWDIGDSELTDGIGTREA